ncbi:ATP-binding protein [Halorubrum sp. AJ67]|uniref:ATP-binding protein n=1 Tax=Halorubrum sp. AJ67 TaxID=1173487 RepID=UPI0009ACFFCD|nr:ATP-binding protein [Halorubrum sp. AJ67]
METAPPVVRVCYLGGEPDRGETVADRLERADGRFDVELAADVDEALDRLAECEFDCVVSERGPRVDALDALERVREAHPNLPFLLVVGGESDETVAAALDAGATDVFRRGPETGTHGVLANRIAAVCAHEATDLSYRTELLDEALAIADVGAWEYDVETERLAWTAEVYRIFDRSPNDDPTLEGALNGYHSDDRERVREAVKRAQGGEPYDLEVRIDAADGDPRWVRTRGEPRFEDGTVVRVRGTVQEITERKRRELAVEALHDIATSIQTAETVEAASEQTVAAAADVLDFHMCTVVLHEGDWLVPYATSEDAPTGGSRRMRTDQGLAGRTFQSGGSYVIDEVNGEESDPANPSYRSGLSVPIGEYGVFQAVSTEPAAFDEEDIELAELLVSHTANAIDRIEREAELKRQNERLDRFASIASHDLRNPLNVAQGRVELARTERDGPHLEAVDRAHDRMEALIEDLLRLAREGEAVTETEPVDLAELTRDCWRAVGTDAATIAVDVDGSVRADRRRLRRLVENLLRNAVEHGSTSSRTESDDAVEHAGDDASITVGSLSDGFYVADDGPGIPEDERDDVFEAGYSTSAEGTGLGLNIVARTAEAHGWDVRVTEGERGGARFEVTGVESAD